MENFERNQLDSVPGPTTWTPGQMYTHPSDNQPYIAPVQSQTQFQAFSFPEPPKKKKEKKKEGGAGKRILCAVLAVVLVVGSSCVTAACLNSTWEKKLNAQAAQQKKEMDELRRRIIAQAPSASTVQPDGSPVVGELTPSQVYAMNVDAVVAISNQVTTNVFGQVSRTASSGSGFIISKDGYVVTNYHVIEGATTLTVITADSVEHNAEVAGYDASNDLAVLKISGEDFPCVSIGSSNDLVVGSMVAAIGNPLGELTSTFTVGYVSAMDRMVNTDGTSMSMIQTDAAINSGNSGGPLFNMKGQVIGITTSKYSGTSNSGATIEGIGFAIPMDDVQGMIDDILEYGFVKSGYLGVMVQDVPAEDSAKYGLPTGALVLEVVEGGCAHKAGIQAGDIITDVGGNPVDSLASLSKVLRNFEAGQEAEVTLYRSGSYVKVNVIFDEKPQETATQTPEQQVDPTVPNGYEGFGGFWPFFP